MGRHRFHRMDPDTRVTVAEIADRVTPIDPAAPAAFDRVMAFAHSMEGLPYLAPDGKLFSLDDGYPPGDFSDLRRSI